MIKKDEVILITGCGGMLGVDVYAVLKDRAKVYATDIDINEPWLSRLDVSSKTEVDRSLDKLKPDYIVHLAALTDMEYCELNPAHAFSTNEDGVKNFLPYVKKNKIPFVYISTAGIFDGEKDSYTEEDIPDPPAPLSVYGKSKYGGEVAAKSLGTHIVIRAGWMMGGGPRKDKKFINKIIKQLRTGIKEIAALDDKFGTPTYTHDLAKIIEYLLDNKFYGLYHGTCEGSGSRYNIADFLLKNLPLDREVAIKKVDSGFFRETYFAPRPRSENLSNLKLKKINPALTREWQTCLAEYLGRYNWQLQDLNTSGMERSFYKNYFSVERDHWLMKGRRLIVSDILKKNLDKSAAKPKILDFGCGSGFFVSQLDKEGYDSYGLDISWEAIEYGKRQGIKNLGVIDSHKINFPDGHFDSVLALDVIEHLEDETWGLKEMERVLRSGGTLVILAPAFKFLWGVQDEASHHYRRYTMSDLVNKIKKSTNLEAVRKSYFNTFLFLPIAAVRLLTRWLKIKNRESDFDLNSPIINFLLSLVFGFERQLLRFLNFPFGVSIMLVLKKPAYPIEKN